MWLPLYPMHSGMHTTGKKADVYGVEWIPFDIDGPFQSVAGPLSHGIKNFMIEVSALLPLITNVKPNHYFALCLRCFRTCQVVPQRTKTVR